MSNHITSNAVCGDELDGCPDPAGVCPWKLINSLEVFVVIPYCRVLCSCGCWNSTTVRIIGQRSLISVLDHGLLMVNVVALFIRIFGLQLGSIVVRYNFMVGFSRQVQGIVRVPQEWAHGNVPGTEPRILLDESTSGQCTCSHHQQVDLLCMVIWQKEDSCDDERAGENTKDDASGFTSTHFLQGRNTMSSTDDNE